MVEIDLSYLGFEETGHQGVLCFDHVNGIIEICQRSDYDEIKSAMVEQEFEGLISHEVVHAVLHGRISERASRYYDNLNEYVGHTPYSYPQSSVQTANKTVKEP